MTYELKSGQVWKARNGDLVTLRRDSANDDIDGNGGFDFLFGCPGGYAYGNDPRHGPRSNDLNVFDETIPNGLDLIELVQDA